MKIPRDIDADKLIKLLKELDYFPTRQTGSHIRLTKTNKENQHHLTIPNHKPIKLGTLNSILNELSSQLKMDKKDLVIKLFASK